MKAPLRLITAYFILLAFTGLNAQKKHDLNFGCHMTGEPVILPSLTEEERATCSSNERSDTLDILHYDIDLDLTKFGTSIISECTITFTAKEDGIEFLPLDLLKLNVDSVVMPGNHLTFDYNDTLLNLHLPMSINIGDTVDVSIFYQGLPSFDRRDNGQPGWGGYRFDGGIGYNLGIGLYGSDPFNMGRSWHPCFDNFVERATYDISIISNGGRKGYAIGEFLGEENLGGDTIRRSYHMDLPNPTYLVGTATSNFVEIHDIHSGAYGDYPILLVGRPGDVSDIEHDFKYLGDACDALESWFGPYPWRQLGYVMTPQGAMEHSSLIAYPYPNLGDPDTFGVYRLIGHELAHHWWGNITTLTCPENMWIKEGNAEYGAQLFIEHTFGREVFTERIKDKHLDVMRNAHSDDGDMYHPLSGIPFEHTYGTHTYHKGALMMHNLRGYLGDSLFSKSMTSVLETFRFSAIDAQQMEEQLTTASGIDMSHFFNGWIYQPGFASYEMDSIRYEPNGNGYNATIHVQQKLHHALSFHTNTPLEITFFDENWNAHHAQFMASGEYSEATVQVPFTPVYQVMNDRNLLNLARVQDRKVIKETGNPNLKDIAFFNTDVTELGQGDSALVNVIHHWVGADPDPTLPDLRISSTHYWTVGGDWPSSFSMKASMRYNGNNEDNFDFDLVGVNADSLILVWRPNASVPWGEYPFYIKDDSPVPVPSLGSIHIDPMLPGDYAFANGEAPLATAVSDLHHEVAIKCYPNPTNELLNVQAVLPSTMDVQLSVFDALGKIATSSNIQALGGQLSETMEVGNLPTGMYWLEISSVDGAFRSVEKFVKQ